MITTPLLEDKYKAQKQLDEEAQHDIVKYVENSRNIVREVETKYGVKFNYGHLQGGKIEPTENGVRPKMGSENGVRLEWH